MAHEAGVRWFAMEALVPAFADEANETRQVPIADNGYLAQPEMRELIATALTLGWQLVAYEADFARKPAELPRLSVAETNWREEQQADHLCAALDKIPAEEALLVWCGNHHLAKHTASEWVPMGVRLSERAAIEPFAIDQTPTVKFAERDPYALQWVEAFVTEIHALGGRCGLP